MNARMRNAMRATVAATVMTMSATTLASAVQTGRGVPRDTRVPVRTVAQYVRSAWVRPAAVVLKSEKAWDKWNALQVECGRAVAAEPAPTDVNWKTESVLVVALGENLYADHNLSVSEARKYRETETTEVHLNCGSDWGGPSASVVVVLPRSASHKVKLVSNVPLPDMPEAAEEWVATSSDDSTAPVTMVVSWGSLKADYR